jgi:hypothetical protein
MKRTTKKPPLKTKRAGFSGPAVDAVFSAYSTPIKTRLLALRRWIFETAANIEGVGALQETLKWGQPSYLTPQTKSGSTIRIDRVKSGNQVAIYFHCQTDLDRDIGARRRHRQSGYRIDAKYQPCEPPD